MSAQPGVRRPLVDRPINATGSDRHASASARQGKPTGRVSVGGGRRPRVSAVEPPANVRGADPSTGTVSPRPITVDSTSFEEWMKLATDNKINASNTWNFALIDYFHDMSLLRSDSGDGSINFQKASCTLDGCVKVWTSRVDSVVVETGRLLNGLQDEPSAKNKRSNARTNDEDDEEDAVDEDGEPIAAQGKRKRKQTKESTLVKDFSQLALKRFDLEFSVDPLFKKTSADFDEGGAGGLLMNHLGVDSVMRIVFDAGDAPGIPESSGLQAGVPLGETQADTSGDQSDAHTAAAGAAVEVESIDMFSKLATKLLGTEQVPMGTELNASLTDLLGAQSVCPTFAPFRFADDDEGLFEDLASAPPPETQFDNQPPMSAPSWSQAPYAFDDDMPALEDAPEADGDADLFEDAALADAVGPGFGPGAEQDDMDMDMPGDGGFDPVAGGRSASAARPAGQDVFAALGDFRLDDGADGNHGDALFELFDAQLSKNWAGPEHWKARRLLGRDDKDKVAGKDTNKEASTSKRTKKQPLVIDFEDPDGGVDAKALFAPPSSRTGAGGITLPRPRKHHDQGANQFLLPPDTHFNSRQLLRLFTNPRMLLNVRRRGAPGSGAQVMADESLGLPLGGDDDVGDTFWADAQAAREGAGGGNMDFDVDMGMDDAPTVPFGDNGFDDLDDMPALDEGFERPVSFGTAKEEDWDEEQLARERQARQPAATVNYARKAKRIDVRRLKENIWRGLSIKGATSNGAKLDHGQGQGQDPDPDPDQDADSSAESAAPPEFPSSKEPRTMNTILTGLKSQYGRDQLEEISTSFCFICLLHLANEEGLTVNHSVAVVDDDDDDEGAPADPDAEGFVGALDELQVARDPTAGRGA